MIDGSKKCKPLVEGLISVRITLKTAIMVVFCSVFDEFHLNHSTFRQQCKGVQCIFHVCLTG